MWINPACVNAPGCYCSSTWFYQYERGRCPLHHLFMVGPRDISLIQSDKPEVDLLHRMCFIVVLFGTYLYLSLSSIATVLSRSQTSFLVHPIFFFCGEWEVTWSQHFNPGTLATGDKTGYPNLESFPPQVRRTWFPRRLVTVRSGWVAFNHWNRKRVAKNTGRHFQ